MPDKKVAFRCYHPDCASDPPTELIIQVPRGRASGGEHKEKLVYCARNHANLITLPRTWNVTPLVLGEDVTADSNGTPVLQGRQG